MSVGRRENKINMFMEWFAWSLTFGDCDPAVWLANYLNKRFEHNIEQRFWFAWLYGNTYHLPTAWVLMNEFPDLELTDPKRVESWHNQNYRRLRYQTDTKWSKPSFPEMLISYKEMVRNSGSQEVFFLSLCQGSPEDNFDRAWKTVKGNQFKFGRYSTWFYLQQVASTCGINMEPSSLMLKDYSGSKSHRNGLLYVLGREDWLNEKLDTNQYDTLEREASEILQEFQSNFPQFSSVSNLFMMETALCSFKKLFRESRGRYLGYYLDRQSEEIQVCEKDGWVGINWEVLWQARAETIPSKELSTGKPKVTKEWFSYYLDNGTLLRAEWSLHDYIDYGWETGDRKEHNCKRIHQEVRGR